MRQKNDTVRVEDVIRWAVRHSFRESIFLTPDPAFLLDSYKLLTFLKEQAGWTDAEVDAVCIEAGRDGG